MILMSQKTPTPPTYFYFFFKQGHFFFSTVRASTRSVCEEIPHLSPSTAASSANGKQAHYLSVVAASRGRATRKLNGASVADNIMKKTPRKHCRCCLNSAFRRGFREFIPNHTTQGRDKFDVIAVKTCVSCHSISIRSFLGAAQSHFYNS